MVHSKSTKSDVFSHKCTRPTFVLVRRLNQSDVCTSPTFVLVRRLYWSDVCTSPTFVRPTLVLSDVCGVRRLYWYHSEIDRRYGLQRNNKIVSRKFRIFRGNFCILFAREECEISLQSFSRKNSAKIKLKFRKKTGNYAKKTQKFRK